MTLYRKPGKTKPRQSARRWPWWRVLLIVVLTAGGLMGGGATAVTWYVAQDLPSLDSLHEYQPSLVTRVYADDRQVIGQFYVERRYLTPIAEIPDALINAVIAVEDARFFEHPGLDIIGIVRAVWTNLKEGGKVEGASTITQQLARSLFLSQARTYERKLRELILAYKMELILTKEQILEMYLNQIYFGQGAYGVRAASLTYFDKELQELNVAECAFLAGLPKAPNNYSPYKNLPLAKRRQKHVLNRMVEEGFIDPATREQAAAYELTFLRPDYERVGSYFVEYVRQQLVDTYGEAMVYKGGLQVYTTLNIEMQKLAEHALREGLRQLDKRQGWRGPIGHRNTAGVEQAYAERDLERLEPPPAPGDMLEGVVTKVTTKEAEVIAGPLKGRLRMEDMKWARRRLEKGAPVTSATVDRDATVSDLLTPGDVIEVRVKAVKEGTATFALEQTPDVQGALIALDPRSGAIQAMVGGYNFKQSQYNRAVMAKRQPGSAFKPLIYATALNQGLSPATRILDAPVIYKDEDSEKTWKPENYERRFFGLIDLREALVYSHNAATIRLLDRIGVRNVINVARSAGIQSPMSPDLSLALGSSSLTLLELTSAYGVFANQGLRVEPFLITRVQDAEGTIQEQKLWEPAQALSPTTAYMVTNMLMDVIQRGTGKKARSIGRPIAGKTGTTNGFRDAWFAGYAPNLATGVWVGFDNARALGRRESGARAALPIWKQFMEQALPQLPVMAFDIPEGVTFAEIEPQQRDPLVRTSDERSHGRIEVFAEGTEPDHPRPERPTPLDFYEFDTERAPASRTGYQIYRP